jgi:DedD protein
MEKKLINRLVIAIVIVALAVIFIPMLFSGHGYKSNLHIDKIPTEPTMPKYDETVVVPAPDKVKSAAAQQIESSAQPSISSPSTDASVISKAGKSIAKPFSSFDSASYRLSQAKEAAVAWVVQLPTAGTGEQADEFIHALHVKHYKVFTRKTMSGKTEIYLEPVKTKEEADRLVAKVDTDLGAQGVELPFDPSKMLS